MSTVDDQIKDILADVKSYAAHSMTSTGMERTLLSRIEIACRALVGQEREQDLGPWTMSPDGRLLSSDNFDHDVQLKVTGDFYGDADRAAYSRRLIEQLNQAKTLREGLPVEPPPHLLHSMALRYRHDFGLTRKEEDGPLTCGVTDDERRAILTTMRQLYEEVAGHGFFTYA